MNISLDYDNTYTRDPEMWQRIIPIFIMHNVQVYVVTSRSMDTPIDLIDDFVKWKIPVVYCEYRAKRDVCREQGIEIDIWMDDDPYYINTGFVTEDTPLTLIKEVEKNYR